MKLKKNSSGVLFITYDCPSCQTALKNRAEQIGESTKCRECGSQFSIPGTEIYQSYLAAQSQKERPASQSPKKVQPEARSSRRLSTPNPNLEHRESVSDPLRIDVDQSYDPYSTRTFSSSRSDTGSPQGYSDGFDSYISMTLSDDERILIQFGPASAAVLALQILLLIMGLIWMVIAGFMLFVAAGGDFFTKLFSILYTFCMFVLPTLIALLRILKRKYSITSHRLVSRSGLASLSVNEVRNDAVSGLAIRQSLFGRWFGYGTVHVYADGTSLKLTSVDNPITIAQAVQSAIDHVKSETR
ncbi:MAG: Bacterial domain [Planctomycetota bacterium]|jgi:DNA-directed RNA polymerase subunit M/transcription elongation factor TFIIS